MRMYVCSRGRVSDGLRRRRQRLCGMVRGLGYRWPLENSGCFKQAGGIGSRQAVKAEALRLSGRACADDLT